MLSSTLFYFSSSTSSFLPSLLPFKLLTLAQLFPVLSSTPLPSVLTLPFFLTSSSSFSPSLPHHNYHGPQLSCLTGPPHLSRGGFCFSPARATSRIARNIFGVVLEMCVIFAVMKPVALLRYRFIFSICFDIYCVLHIFLIFLCLCSSS